MTIPLIVVNVIFAGFVLIVGLQRDSVDGMMFYLLGALTLYTVVEVYTDRAQLVISTKLLLWTLNLFCSLITLLLAYLVQAGWSEWLLLAAMAITAASTLLTLTIISGADDDDDSLLDDDEPWMRDRG